MRPQGEKFCLIGADHSSRSINAGLSGTKTYQSPADGVALVNAGELTADNHFALFGDLSGLSPDYLESHSRQLTGKLIVQGVIGVLDQFLLGGFFMLAVCQIFQLGQRG